jgi:hypothetical protein
VSATMTERFLKIPLRAAEVEDMSAGRFRVLAVLVQFRDNVTGLSVISRQKLAARARVHPVSVSGHLTGLQDNSIIEILRRPGRSSVYRVIYTSSENATGSEDVTDSETATGVVAIPLPTGSETARGVVANPLPISRVSSLDVSSQNPSPQEGVPSQGAGTGKRTSARG